MKGAKWMAIVTGLGLAVTLLLPGLTDGRVDWREVQPLFGPLVGLFVLSSFIALRGRRQASGS